MNRKQESGSGRVWFLIIASLAVMAVFLLRLVQLQIIQGEQHLQDADDTITYEFGKDVSVRKIYITFDSNLNRDYKNMPQRILLDETKFRVPETLVKCYKIVGTDSQGNTFTISDDHSHLRFITHDVQWKVSSVELIPLETYGCEEFRVFRFEVE